MHKRGAITVLSELFVSQDRNEKLCKGTLLFSGNFLESKKFMDKRGHITIFSQNFYVSQCRKLSWGNPTVFEKIFGFKKFYGWKGRYHVFPSKIFGLTVPKNFMGILQCFRKFGVSKNFMHTYHVFPSKIFGLTVPKNFVGILQCFRKFGVSKNFMHTYHVFPSKIFGLTVPKNFVGIPSMFQKIWGIEKFYA